MTTFTECVTRVFLLLDRRPGHHLRGGRSDQEGHPGHVDWCRPAHLLFFQIRQFQLNYFEAYFEAYTDGRIRPAMTGLAPVLREWTAEENPPTAHGVCLLLSLGVWDLLTNWMIRGSPDFHPVGVITEMFSQWRCNNIWYVCWLAISQWKDFAKYWFCLLEDDIWTKSTWLSLLCLEFTNNWINCLFWNMKDERDSAGLPHL